VTDDRRSEGDPGRACAARRISAIRFPRIADAYVRERIAEIRRPGAAAVGEHRSDRLHIAGPEGRTSDLVRGVLSSAVMKTDNRIEPDTVIHTQVAAAREGRDPRVIARLYSGWAVFGERQFLRGYALLLPDPVVPSLNALGAQERTGFLLDMARLGDALLKVTGAIRINYAIYGNIEPALHAHVIPRYADEVDKLRTAQPWAYDWAAAPAFDRTAYQELAESLRKELTRMGVTKQMRFDPGANVNG
jgi:diadenosine tetraphosphate (Ap4A) HIT family hydrolase